MSPLPNPVTNKVIYRRTWSPMDPDAATYIAAVEQADGQALEEKVKIAIDNFVLGCKADGIWDAIKASCILAGARTLEGALKPLKGTAPTNNNFVSGDYNRKTGLIGNGSNKYLNSNRNTNADPQDNQHLAVHLSAQPSVATALIVVRTSEAGTGDTGIFANASASNWPLRSRLTSFDLASQGTRATSSVTGFLGISRSSSSSFISRLSGSNQAITSTSSAPGSANLFIFARNRASNSTIDSYSNSRLAFYSIGESLDLAKLDGRVTDLINAFGRVIA